jgi:hypothetical protein
MAESADAPTSAAPDAAGPDAAEARGWIGGRLDDIAGASVGKIESFHVDEATGRPEWLAVRTGRFGHHALVPAREAVGAVGRVWVPYSRDLIKRAPKVNTRGPLTREAELELLEHYGVQGEIGRAAELSQHGFEAITASPAT